MGVHCRTCRIKWYISTYQPSPRGSHSCAETRASLQLFLLLTVVAKLKLRVLTSAGRSLSQLQRKLICYALEDLKTVYMACAHNLLKASNDRSGTSHLASLAPCYLASNCACPSYGLLLLCLQICRMWYGCVLSWTCCVQVVV